MLMTAVGIWYNVHLWNALDWVVHDGWSRRIAGCFIKLHGVRAWSRPVCGNRRIQGFF